MLNYFMVGIGGFLGAVARFWIADYVGNKFGTRFPLGTFLINCSGCFAIGVIVTLLDHRSHWNPHWRYLIPIGFIGAYTTFSSFELETLRSMQEGRFAIALLNVTLSVAVGFAFVWLGVSVGNRVVTLSAQAKGEYAPCAIAASSETPVVALVESASD